jgi:hypothetical protein
MTIMAILPMSAFFSPLFFASLGFLSSFGAKFGGENGWSYRSSEAIICYYLLEIF